MVELRPSGSGVKKSVITDIGIMRTNGNWRVVNNHWRVVNNLSKNLSPECRDKKENTPVDAEGLIDWMEWRED